MLMKLNPVVTALSTVVVLWSTAAQAAPSYSVTALNINTLGSFNRGADINASGQVVGSFRPSGFSSNSHAFLIQRQQKVRAIINMVLTFIRVTNFLQPKVNAWLKRTK